MNADLLQSINPQNNNSSLRNILLQKNIAAPEEASSSLVSVLKNNSRFRYDLVHYALKHIRFCFRSDTMNGLLATDVVQIVLEKIISGIRRWNKSEFPDIRKFIFVTIQSFIRNESIRARIPKVINMTTLFAENESELVPIPGTLNENKKFSGLIFASRTEFTLNRIKENFRLKNTNILSV